MTTTFQRGDRVQVPPLDDAPGYEGVVSGSPTSFGSYPVRREGRELADWIESKHLSLIPEPAAPKVTPEQRAAVERLNEYADRTWGGQMRDDWQVVLGSLPAELTAPQPDLPTEPGHYLTPNKSLVTLDDEGDWTWGDGGALVHPDTLLPLRRLVPERPAITREQVVDALSRGGYDSSQVDAILALVNGTDR